ncbi:MULTISPECIES: acyl carrier protein [Chryseobacterium]|uniref:acyl carrier protein n=1 Tax=Chryseobacterium TaxID=59732 RepID=UPI001BE6F23C|nr:MULTISPECIES: acyl carrier protein [Chryseobacterium]MBT2621788.1 acyl carrier protein [Chryseobacterium sp. ISL-6]
MKIEHFCELLKQELNEQTIITSDTNFKELESYGSLSAVLVMQLVENQFGVSLNPRSFRNINTIGDLTEAIGIEKFD